MYAVFNAIAHLAMLLLVFEIFVLITVPALAIGLGGILGRRFVRKRLPEWLPRLRELPKTGMELIDHGCNAAAWPVIQATALWRGTKVALDSLRRQSTQR